MSKIKKIIAHARSDQELLDGIRLGDNAAIAYIYKSCYPSVSHMIINSRGNEDEAKDIFQEAILVLYDKVTHQQFELSSKLSTFLYAVCRRLWLKQLGKKGFSVHLENQEDLDLPELDKDLTNHAEQELKFEQMEVALAGLGEPCVTILKDFYIENKSMQDICNKLGYTNTDNAKNQKYKCLQRLKRLFFEQQKRNEE